MRARQTEARRAAHTGAGSGGRSRCEGAPHEQVQVELHGYDMAAVCISVRALEASRAEFRRPTAPNPELE